MKFVKLIAFSCLFLALSGCGGVTTQNRLSTPSTPLTPSTPAEATSLSNMTGEETLSGFSSVTSKRIENNFLESKIVNDATIVINNNTNEIRLILSQELTNNEIFDLDVTVDLDTDVFFENDGIATIGKRLDDGNSISLYYLIPGEVQAAGDAYNYTTGAFWVLTNENTNAIDVGFIVSGFETEPDDMPISGSAVYNVIAQALISYGGDDGWAYRASGTGDFNVSFATGEMIGNFPLLNITDFDGDALVLKDQTSSLGGFSLEGSISSGSSHFSGTTYRAAGGNTLLPEMNGTFSGSFFGPDANEIGGAFILEVEDADSIGGNLFLTGGFIGKMQDPVR